MIYWRFWETTFKNTLYAAGISLFHDIYLQYSMYRSTSKRDSSFSHIHKSLYHVAQSAFREMGADLERHPLELSSIDGAHDEHAMTLFYKNPITGAYCLQVDSEAFKHYQQIDNSPDLSSNEYYRAVFAHEAVHAIENHNFLKVYAPVWIALSMLNICEAVGMRLAWMCVIGPMLLFSTSCYVGRQLELRADRLAAEKSPLIRESLIKMFSAMAHDHQPTPGFSRFFHDHPPMSTRLAAIIP